MPTLQLKLYPPMPDEVQATLARELTALTAEQLGKRAEVTALMIECLPAPRWHIGGQPPRGPTAWLEVSITAGTNTAAEKAAFIEAAFALLRRRLAGAGRLEEASYVSVHELPATDWGYGGRTQAARQAARTAQQVGLAQVK